ncbi:tRNA pseudouridine(38/39) synthase [Contarinia nasturtii]|uniref:tRNA pseudouridine(38/39) synthase n=1 Tax=Contarinia nasturtii TaxID=265458 RepID=UPI0012D425B3|nr:tRNA pseudouridine(38/39) synthase [Contarinia nasturtii]
MDENLTIFVNRRKKLTTREELEKCSKEELINRILQLETHNQQLKNVLKKELNCGDDESKITKQKKFDFSNRNTRHVLLKLYYLGWDYQGFATQEESIKTIEHHLFAALKRTCLIESRETSNYHRCGRTDKGVSAFSQVISIDLRSKYPDEDQMTEDSIKNEIRYCDSLNRVLPQDIRVVAWQPLYNREFSSRFDCRERVYRYFFPRSNLNIEAMRKACTYLIGIHDFRNLCKMDVANGVVTFERELRDVRVVEASRKTHDNSSPYDMHYVELIGKAFLWHQVRAIMAILLLVGQEDEKPEIVQELLDIERNPCTPQYSLAADFALNLFDVDMEEYSKCTVPTGPLVTETKQWIYDSHTLGKVIGILQGQWTQLSVKSHMIIEMLNVLEDIYENKLGANHIYKYCDALQEGVRSKKYKPLLTRNKCSSLENRIQHYSKKRRIDLINTDEANQRKQDLSNPKQTNDEKMTTY